MKVEKIDQILNRTFKKLGLEKRFKESELLNSWEKTVGRQIARHTQPLGIKRKKLFINVDSPTWAYQLTLYNKTEILNKLNQEAEEQLIEDIYFKIGAIQKNG